VEEQGGVVVIHCAEGISRSATGVLATLMINHKMTLGDAMHLLRSVKSNVEPNNTFLRELRTLEKQLFGEFTSGKLTFADNCKEPPNDDDWREEFAIILASAAMGDVSMAKLLERGNQCGLEAMKRLDESDKTKKEQLLDFISCGLESYGGRNAKDVRARQALDMIVQDIAERSFKDDDEYSQTLDEIERSEQFGELVMDVPIAKQWLVGLQHEAKHLSIAE
jgi:hypothetical protein